MSRPRICVVGSSNFDLTAFVPRLPQPGETLHATRLVTGFGGKGANQAVCAARLGAEVALVAKLGRDATGDDTVESFRAHGIDLRGLLRTEAAPSGMAAITVDPRGENTIVVAAGANALLTAGEVEAARDLIARADVLLTQLEVPLEATLCALRIAREAGVRTLLDPAPAPGALPEEALALADVLCPNQNEAARLAGLDEAPRADTGPEPAAAEAARRLRARGAHAVVVSLGEGGSLIVDERGARRAAAPSASTARDASGAGDAFRASLGVFLAAGRSLEQAAVRAHAVATTTVAREGTQQSYPRRDELPPEVAGTLG